MEKLKPIVLVGMMGSGKTLIGKQLAKRFNIDFIDIDKIIKEKTKYSVTEIINLFSAKTLKEIEYKLLKEIVQKPCVISTSDTTVENQQAWNFLLKNGLIIWLNINLKVIFQRLKPNENRPFFSTESTQESILEIYKKRKKRYNQAHIKFSYVKLSILETMIRKHFQKSEQNQSQEKNNI